jgi:hypothetical protein
MIPSPHFFVYRMSFAIGAPQRSLTRAKAKVVTPMNFGSRVGITLEVPMLSSSQGVCSSVTIIVFSRSAAYFGRRGGGVE